MPKTAKEVTDAVFSVYECLGSKAYLGEEVAQLEHAVQCAMLAEKEGLGREVILGAFLHDIGHLLKDADVPSEIGGNMLSDGVTLALQGHDKIGAYFLSKFSVPEEVTAIGRWHVDAKRYLCFKDHHNKLPETSNLTLIHQGGAMGAAEAAEFEKRPDLQTILKGRQWDEQAKVANMEGMESVNKYRDMFQEYMASVIG